MASKCGVDVPTPQIPKAIEVRHEIVIEDFKKWHRLCRFFEFEVASKKNLSHYFDVGLGFENAVYLEIEMAWSGNDHVVIEMKNKSPCRICLGGRIEFLDQDHNSTFEATRLCGESSRFGDECTCQINTSTNSCKMKGHISQRLKIDETLLLQDTATIIFELKFFPHNSPSISANNETKAKIKQDGESALRKDMAALRGNEKTADVTIICNEKRLRAHKLILSARSSIFDAMFSHKGFVEHNTGTVVIKDCDEDSMEMFLAYLYEGVLHETSFEAAEALINLATKYDVRPLRDACLDIFLAHLEEGNAIRVLILSSMYNLDALKIRALDTIVASNKPLKTMIGWEDLEKIQDLKIEIIDYKASK